MTHIIILKKWRELRGKLKFQLYAGYLVTFLAISVLTVWTVYGGVKSLIIEQIGSSRTDVLKQVAERSNSIKNSTITLSNLYRYDTVVLDSFQQPAVGEEGERKAYLDGLKSNYDKIFHDVGVAYEVVLIGENGFGYSSAGGSSYNFAGLKKQLWFKKCWQTEGDIVFTGSFLEQFSSAEKTKEQFVFSAFGKVASPAGERLGVVLINVDEKYLENIYTSLSDGKSSIYIFDAQGNIVSSRNKSMLGKNFIGVENFRLLYGDKPFSIVRKLGSDYLLSHCYDSQTGWTIVEEMPCSVIFEPLYGVFRVLMTALGGCLLVALAVSWYMANRISGPIRKLCLSMNQVKKGNLDVTSRIGGYEEARWLGNSFNDMAAEIKCLMENIRQKEINKKRTEMDFLRAQINPHFMYNTLFSIQCMTELGKNDQAVSMMSAFINLLKRTLSVDTERIPLGEEYENTERYLILQQIRYGDKIHFECAMEENCRNCLVLPLMIQPIVENAIFHGLEGKEQGGLLVVEAAREGNTLQISVSDDGRGLGEEELSKLRCRLMNQDAAVGNSIGIMNVHNRIRIHFGDNYGVEIDSEEGVGTTVLLRLPVILKGREGGRDR